MKNKITNLSNPRKASGSILTNLFSYNVKISKVSKPSKALLWITEILLWFKFKINKWWRFFNAVDGTFCSWFCETSSCVNPFPVNNKGITKWEFIVVLYIISLILFFFCLKIINGLWD